MPQPITAHDIGLIDSLPLIIGCKEIISRQLNFSDQASSNLLQRLLQGKEHTELIFRVGVRRLHGIVVLLLVALHGDDVS